MLGAKLAKCFSLIGQIQLPSSGELAGVSVGPLPVPGKWSDRPKQTTFGTLGAKGNTVQCILVQCSAMQSKAIHCSAVQCSAVKCSRAQCSTVQCSEVQCRAVELKCDLNTRLSPGVTALLPALLVQLSLPHFPPTVRHILPNKKALTFPKL